jgi:HAE1 family hydrophobic/amphiphilic exporter-1
MENAYTGFIGRMVRVSGLTVLIGLLLAAAGIWGIARLPTAFIPNEDQGYLLIVAQLPDGAALGRTTAALDQATKIAQDTPGVDTVIAISGLSALDNFADLGNAGVCFVVLKPWDQRSKGGGNGHPDDRRAPAECTEHRARRQAYYSAATAHPGHR